MKKLGRSILYNITLAGLVLGGVDLYAIGTDNAPVIVEGITEQPASEASPETSQPTYQATSDRGSSQTTSTNTSGEAPLREASATPVEAGGSNMAAIAAGVAGAALGVVALGGLGYWAYQNRTLGTTELLEKKADLQKKLTEAQGDPKKIASIQKDIDDTQKLLDAKTNDLNDEKTKLEADKKELEAKVMAADKDNPKPLTDDEAKRLKDANERLAAIDAEQKKITSGPSAVKKSTAWAVTKALVTQDTKKLQKFGGNSALARASTAGTWTRAGSYTSGDLRRDAKSVYSRAKTALSGSTPAKQPTQSSSVTSTVDDKENNPKPTSSNDALNKLRAEATQKTIDARSEPVAEPEVKKTPPPPPTTPKPPVPTDRVPKTQSLTAAQQATKDAEAKRAATELKPLDTARMIQNKQGGYVGQALTGRVQ